MKSSEIRKIISVWELLNDSNQDEIDFVRDEERFDKEVIKIIKVIIDEQDYTCYQKPRDNMRKQNLQVEFLMKIYDGWSEANKKREAAELKKPCLSHCKWMGKNL